MGQTFRTCALDQPFLFSPSLDDWLPQNHLARFIAEVVHELDLSAITGAYGRKDNRGRLAYHPEMMTRLLLYAYCVNQPSSRKIEEATVINLAFRYLAANQQPDHDTVAEFRRRHLAALASLFVQVLKLCKKAGLVRLGHVAIDGTKVKANASRHRSESYDDLCALEKQWKATVDALLKHAEEVDQAEAEAPEPLPANLAQAETRLAAIRAAKQSLQEQAKQQLERMEAATKGTTRRTGRPRKGEEPQRTPGEQSQHNRLKKALRRARTEAKHPTSAYNFVDPDSRLMRDNATRGIVQSYNAQLAVDDHAQIIVACDVSQDSNDRHLLIPMIKGAEQNLEQRPVCVTADSGYFGTAAIEVAEQSGYNLLVPPDRTLGGPLPSNAPRTPVAIAMRERLKLDVNRALYRKRSSTVEPVFGYTKQQRGYGRFALRGHQPVRGEWALICTSHNLRKLFKAR